MKEVEISKELGYIIGVRDGDLCITHGVIELSVIDKDFIDEFKRNFEQVFNKKMIIKKRYDVRHTKGFCWRVRACSVELCKFLKIFDRNKILNSSSKEIKGAYLRGFFDSEGCACLTKQTYIMINNIKLENIKFCKKLLEDLNIKTTRVYEISNNGKRKNHLHQIFIRKWNENLINFKNNVGFSIKRKMKNLDVIIKKCHNYSPSDYKNFINIVLEDKKMKNELVIKIQNLRRKGLTYEKIGEILKISRRNAENWYKGIKPMPISHKEISKKTGVNENVINKWLNSGAKPNTMLRDYHD